LPLPTGDGYVVTIPFANLADQDYLMVARSIWVGWTNVPSGVPASAQPHLTSCVTTPQGLTVVSAEILPWLMRYGSPASPNSYAPQQPAFAPWTMWTYGNRQARSLLSGSGTNSNGEDQLFVFTGLVPGLQLPVLNSTLVDGEPLHLSFVAAENGKLFDGEAGTADAFYPTTAVPSGPITLTAHQFGHAIGAIVMSDRCVETTGCFSVALTVACSAYVPQGSSSVTEPPSARAVVKPARPPGPNLPPVAQGASDGTATLYLPLVVNSAPLGPPAIILAGSDLPSGFTLDPTQSGYVDNLTAAAGDPAELAILNQDGRQNGYFARYGNPGPPNGTDLDLAVANLGIDDYVTEFATADGARQYFNLRKSNPSSDAQAVTIPSIGDDAFALSVEEDNDDGQFLVTTVVVLDGPFITYLTTHSMVGADTSAGTIQLAQAAAARAASGKPF
jgi:hypothetical protein